MQTFNDPLDSSLDESSAEKLELTEEIAGYWLTMSGWVLFFSILLFLGAGVLFIVAFVSMNAGWQTLALLLSFTLILFVPAFLLNRFRSRLKRALFDDSAEQLEISFRSFRHFYLLAGILTITFTVLYAAMIAIGIYEAFTNRVQGTPPGY